MTTPADSPIFIDTNVLVFATRRSSQMHKPASAAMHEIIQQGMEAWISRQILREYLVQTTRPGALPHGTAETAAAQVESLYPFFEVADEDECVTEQLLKLLKKIGAAGKQVHDANIVATMLVNEIPQLLTHNVKDFGRYSHLITVIPLVP